MGFSVISLMKMVHFNQAFSFFFLMAATKKFLGFIGVRKKKPGHCQYCSAWKMWTLKMKGDSDSIIVGVFSISKLTN